MSKDAMKLALEALDGLEALLLSMRLTHLIVYGDAEKAITALREALAEQPTDWEAVAADQAMTIALLRAEQPAQQQEPVALETVYETIIQWDEGGGKRSRRELARRIVDLYTSPPAQRKPLTLGQKQRLWSSVGDKPTLKDRVNAYGLAIEAAHGIKENT